jgi:hypothetical protein
MISNMDMRQALINHGDHIITNNQNIAIGNCNYIVKISKSSELETKPYLLNNLYNYFRLENSDIKNNYLSEYMYMSAVYKPCTTIK